MKNLDNLLNRLEMESKYQQMAFTNSSDLDRTDRRQWEEKVKIQQKVIKEIKDEIKKEIKTSFIICNN